MYKGVHIPGCDGCAVYGHYRCTCSSTSHKKDELDRLEARIEKLEARVRKLERKE